MNNDLAQPTLSTESNYEPYIFQSLKHSSLIAAYDKMIAIIDNYAAPFSPFLLHLTLAYEFWETGIMKYAGENWVSHITFPLSFSLLSRTKEWESNKLCILACLFARLLRCGNSYVACYAPIATPGRQTKILRHNCTTYSIPIPKYVLSSTTQNVTLCHL